MLHVLLSRQHFNGIIIVVIVNISYLLLFVVVASCHFSACCASSIKVCSHHGRGMALLLLFAVTKYAAVAIFRELSFEFRLSTPEYTYLWTYKPTQIHTNTYIHR